MKHQTIQLITVIVCALALVAGLANAHPARAASFVVDSSSDNPDANLGDGLCADIGGDCTLRAAVEEANLTPESDTITFSGSTYVYLSSFILVTNPVLIDASSAWNDAGNAPGVILNCSSGSFPGIQLNGNYNTIYGMMVINCSPGLAIHGSNNLIGGPEAEHKRNIFSSNTTGVGIAGVNAHDNVLQSNWIGLCTSGATKCPNDIGITIIDSAINNTIGGDQVGEGNYISGNTTYGVRIGFGCTGTSLGDNWIGLPYSGNADVGNGSAGVRSDASNIHVGGYSLASNYIMENDGNGIEIWNDLATIDGNYINENGMDGIYIEASSAQLTNNVIENNANNGVRIAQGNSNQILSNNINSNGFYGVFVGSGSMNLIIGNSIWNNAGPGIELFTGANGDIPAPSVSTADASGASGTGCANCMIHIYSDSQDEGATYHGSTNADGSGNWTYVGAISGPNVTATNTDSSNNTSEFSAPFTLVTNSAPYTPSNPNPANGATGVSLKPLFSWAGGDPDGDVVTYTVHGGAINPPTGLWGTTIGVTSCPFPSELQLQANTTYYWYVTASDGTLASDSPVWSFTTGAGGTMYTTYLPTLKK